jgi:hypothetical protein
MQKNYKVILVMGLLTAIGPLSIDMYLPAFSAIAKSLHTTVADVTLSLSSFFIGISAGQLLYGPLQCFGTDRRYSNEHWCGRIGHCWHLSRSYGFSYGNRNDDLFNNCVLHFPVWKKNDHPPCREKSTG